MTIKARYVHTSIVAENWLRLARFYERVFGCVPVPPERHLRGPDVEAGTGVPGAEIRGIHLRLPGYNGQGPTLEIFQYNRLEARQNSVINRPGLAHIAFSVEDLKEARAAVIDAGGGSVGDTVTLQVAGAGAVTFVYLTDPEGNIIELQRWV